MEGTNWSIGDKPTFPLEYLEIGYGERTGYAPALSWLNTRTLWPGKEEQPSGSV